MAENTGENEVINGEDLFDVDHALNTKGFPEFLAKYPDAESFDVNNPELVQERFEAFVGKEEVKKGLKKLFAAQIQKEVGIILSDKDLELIDKDIEDKAINDPGSVVELVNQLTRFEEIPDDIIKMEGRLRELGSIKSHEESKSNLEFKKGNLEIAKDHLGLMGKISFGVEVLDYYSKVVPKSLTKVLDFVSGITGSEQIDEVKELEDKKKTIKDKFAAIKFVKERFGRINNDQASLFINKIQTEIENVERTTKEIKEYSERIEQTKKYFANLKNDLLTKVSSIGGLKDLIQDKVKRQFRELTKEDDSVISSLPDLEKAKNMFEDLKERFKTSETGIDPLGSIDESKFTEVINGDMEFAISEMISDVLGKHSGNNSLQDLESALGSILSKTEIGYNTDVTETLVKILDGIRKSFVDKGDSVKKILLARIIRKVKDGKYNKK